MKINKRLQTIVLGMGITLIICAIGSMYWHVLFPVDIEQEEITERVKELQKQRAKWIKSECKE